MQKIQDKANQLKEDIAVNPRDGLQNLLVFAENYSVNDKLRYEAVELITFLKEEGMTERLQNKTNRLLDNIVQNHNRSGIAHQLTDADNVVCSCREVVKFFKKSNFILENINIDLRLGEITSVVGENGNGKTTLFRLIVGNMLADDGDIIFPALGQDDPEELDWFAIKEQIAYVPQDLPVWRGSLKANLQYEAAINGIKGKKNQQEVDFIIHRLGLQSHIDKKWKELSGGYKLRFSLAKALVLKPKLLVIDEPLANLDIKAQQIVLRDLREISKSLQHPVSVILSSQHLHQIESVSDKVLFLKEGMVTYYGKIPDIGLNRACNTFELTTTASLETLKSKLASIPEIEVHHNGICFVIRTALTVDYRQLLTKMLEQQIPIGYFRNISNSVKQLFE